jgi:hypothetical protein
MQAARDAFKSDDELATDEAVLARAFEVEPMMMHPDVMLRRMVEAIKFAEARAGEAKRFANIMKARADRYEAREGVLRHTLLDMMMALERDNFAGSPYGTASVRAGQRSALILDEAEIPDEYFRVKRTLDKRELLDDLRQGVVVPGAVLSNAAPTLVITSGARTMPAAGAEEAAE